MGDLLFHFTRGDEPVWREMHGHKWNTAETAGTRLMKILRGGLRGSSRWTYGINTVCFTEAPIQEFNSVFALASIASERHLRPRYEPYGVAVSKTWLFGKGGRPVIYDDPNARDQYPSGLLHRFCPYNPLEEVDYTWEREWRIQTDLLQLEPQHTLVVVPTSAEAFDIVHEHADSHADVDRDGTATGVFYTPTWLAVSLDMFGFKHANSDA
jgi:hypothetical protein